MVVGFKWVICKQFGCSKFSIKELGDVCVENEWIGGGREVQFFCTVVLN